MMFADTTSGEARGLEEERTNLAEIERLQGVSAITLFTADLRSSKEFYFNFLQASPVYEDDDSAAFKVGSTLINLLRTEAVSELIAPAMMASSGIRAVYTISVPDVDAVCNALLARGIKLLNGPVDRPWGIRTASFQDPSGHVWEIAK